MKLRDNLNLIAPIGGSLIVFASAIKNILFYSVYNIAIIKFITLTDFFLLIIIDAIILITGMVMMGIFYTALETNNTTRNNDTNYESQKLPLIPIMIWCTILSLGLTSLISFGKNFTYSFIGISLAVLFFANIIFFLYMKDKIVRNNKEIFSILTTILSIILIMSALAFRDVYHISNNIRYNEFTIILEDETIVTDDNLIYIGKTSEYIFLYDKKDDKSRILKTDMLKEMRVQAQK